MRVIFAQYAHSVKLPQETHVKRLSLLAVLFGALSASAGERFLGTLTSPAGAEITNATTAVPFVVPTNALLTIQCKTAAAYVITDDTVAVTSVRGVLIGLGVAFPTSTSSQNVVFVSGARSAIVRMIPVSGALSCDVFERRGNE